MIGDIKTHKQHGDYISLLLFYQNKESKLRNYSQHQKSSEILYSIFNQLFFFSIQRLHNARFIAIDLYTLKNTIKGRADYYIFYFPGTYCKTCIECTARLTRQSTTMRKTSIFWHIRKSSVKIPKIIRK
jgi:hypothetical protein